MADVTKTEKNVSVVAEFADGDDRTITLPNPRNDLTWADVEALNASASAVLVGDRAAANFYRMKEAFTRAVDTMYLDLTTDE